MRSRTSRGVPEWSGGKDLYMGSAVLVTKKVSGFIGNVPGPPGGSQGSTKWGHHPRRAAWAKCGRGPAPGGLVHPPQGPKAPRVWGGGAPTLLGGQVSPLPPLAATQMWIGAAATPREGTLGGGAALPFPLYIVEAKGQPNTRSSSPVGAALPLFLLISCGAWRSPAGVPRSSTTTTPLCCCWMESSSTSPSLLAGSRRGRRHRLYVC